MAKPLLDGLKREEKILKKKKWECVPQSDYLITRNHAIFYIRYKARKGWTMDTSRREWERVAWKFSNKLFLIDIFFVFMALCFPFFFFHSPRFQNTWKISFLLLLSLFHAARGVLFSILATEFIFFCYVDTFSLGLMSVRGIFNARIGKHIKLNDSQTAWIIG